MACFRDFCEVSIIREALRKAWFSYMEIYLLKKRSKGLGCGLDVVGCGTGIDDMEGGSIVYGRKLSS